MTQDISEKVLVEVTARLDALCAKLGTTAAYLWPCLVRYEFWHGIAIVGGPALLIIAALVAIRHTIGKPLIVEPDMPTRAMFVLVLSSLALVGSIISIVNSSESIASIAAPEAAAFRSILGR